MNASSTTYIELLLREPTKQRSHFRQCSKITLLRQRPTSILCSLALTGVIKPSEQLRVQKGKWHRIENGCTSFRSLMMKSNKTTTTKTTKMDVCTLQQISCRISRYYVQCTQEVQIICRNSKVFGRLVRLLINHSFCDDDVLCTCSTAIPHKHKVLILNLFVCFDSFNLNFLFIMDIS